MIRRFHINFFVASLGAFGMLMFWNRVYNLPLFNFWSIITSICVWLIIFSYLIPKETKEETAQ